MMATVPHVTSGLGLRKFQADEFLLTRVYLTCAKYKYKYPKAADKSLINKLTETPIKLRVLTVANCCRQEHYLGSSKCQQTLLYAERRTVSRTSS